MANKLLLVDDDTTLLRFMSEYLSGEGYEVVTARSGQDALRLFYGERPDLLILDIMMPTMDGWEVTAKVREMADTPIVLLTAKRTEADKLRGFRLGVDDYITKPFSFAELTARIGAVLARTRQPEEEPDVYAVGDLRIDIRRHELYKEEVAVPLTPIEFRLMEALARNPGEARSHKELLSEAWGELCDIKSSALRRYIWLLRQKLEDDPSSPTRLITVRGYGYRLESYGQGAQEG